ncbi:MAG: DUF308 domain-containing protein [Candidatus Cryptobacteroides sp.]
MKNAKLIIGILSIILCVFITFQSCAAGLSNALSENNESSGSAGLFVAICMLISGIVGIATRNNAKKGSNITVAIFYIIAGIAGISMHGSYNDLIIWSILCFIFGVVYLAAAFKKNKPIIK